MFRENKNMNQSYFDCIRLIFYFQNIILLNFLEFYREIFFINRYFLHYSFSRF
jgi:hypothetical protein